MEGNMLTFIAITAAAMANAAKSPGGTARSIASFSGSAVAKSAAKRVDSFWLHVLAWQMRRMNRAILSSLDDRSLHDIGLHRSGIEAALRGIDAELAGRKRAALRRAGSGRAPLTQTMQGA
jgi:uncharacterized protein YjiS (DUF1127 family)